MTSPARGGPDTAGMREVAREEIARVVYDRDSFAGDLPWSRTAPTERDRCRAIADAILALPVVQRLAVETAAEELRAAAEDVRKDFPALTTGVVRSIRSWLRNRAATTLADHQPTP